MTDISRHTIDLSGKTIPHYIAIEGPIGVGKTTLARYLAETFGHDPLLEQAEENPFLEKFYANEPNAALSTQLFFLFQRARQLSNLRQTDLFKPATVSDFLLEKDELFAQTTLSEEELALYHQVYKHLSIEAPTPDLVIYLQAPVETLLARIKKRGIAAEKNISEDYLHQLNEAYTRLFHFYEASPLLIINVAELDWINSLEHYRKLVDYILTVKSGRHYYNPEATII